MDGKKVELQKLIDGENGTNFHRNIDLSGWNFYKGKSFISFKIVNINGINVVKVNYIYLTSKNDLIKLLSYCINFWAGNNCKMIYFLEHCREANYCKKYLQTIGFSIVEENRKGVYKYPYKSTNGFKEEDIREYYL